MIHQMILKHINLYRFIRFESVFVSTFNFKHRNYVRGMYGTKNMKTPGSCAWQKGLWISIGNAITGCVEQPWLQHLKAETMTQMTILASHI